MVIEVRVCRGDHQFVMIVLQFRQLIWQQAGVMIINQRDASHDKSIRILNGCVNQAITNQIPERFGTVAVALLRR